MRWRDDETAALQQRVQELEESLRAARQAADAERSRADAATESSRRAWQVGLTLRARPHDDEE